MAMMEVAPPGSAPRRHQRLWSLGAGGCDPAGSSCPWRRGAGGPPVGADADAPTTAAEGAPREAPGPLAKGPPPSAPSWARLPTCSVALGLRLRCCGPTRCRPALSLVAGPWCSALGSRWIGAGGASWRHSTPARRPCFCALLWRGGRSRAQPPPPAPAPSAAQQRWYLGRAVGGGQQCRRDWHPPEVRLGSADGRLARCHRRQRRWRQGRRVSSRPRRAAGRGSSGAARLPPAAGVPAAIGCRRRRGHGGGGRNGRSFGGPPAGAATGEYVVIGGECLRVPTPPPRPPPGGRGGDKHPPQPFLPAAPHAASGVLAGGGGGGGGLRGPCLEGRTPRRERRWG